MSCGNKEHFRSKTIYHPCLLCKYWDMDVFEGAIIKEPCITCKKGDCQFVGASE